jgi:hypothetical protein
MKQNSSNLKNIQKRKKDKEEKVVIFVKFIEACKRSTLKFQNKSPKRKIKDGKKRKI